MPVSLLDINVLIALAWPNHEHHHAAHKWFATLASEQFATCPITQCGFVRISSNPKIITEAVSPAAAIASLQRMTAHPNHVFWEDNIELCDATFIPHNRMRGYRQVTDTYLFGLCLKRGGRLATFDSGLQSLAVSEKERACVVVIQN